MKIIVPMAGTGQRFVQEGYADPKPLIKIADPKGWRMIIEHVLDMFSFPSDEFVFVCNDVHLSTTDMREQILRLRPDATVLSMPQHKKGPVYTVVPAFDHIRDDEEVIVSYCDGTILWDRNNFQFNADQNEWDGCLITHTGFHPHTLNSTKMAFLKHEKGVVSEVKEKQSYTDDPMSEHASSGQYYFRRGEYVKKYFERAMERNLNYNGEHYITLVYNLLIEDGLKVGYYDTHYVAILGTPEEVRNFEAWSTILRGSQVKSEEDLLKCYRYWKGYHRIK